MSPGSGEMMMPSNKHDNRAGPLPPSWLFSLITGALTVVAAVFGMYLDACGGIGKAMAFTLILFVLFMPAVPQILIGVTAIVLAVTLCVRWASTNVWMNERISLLVFVLPVLGLVVGVIHGWQIPSSNACVLKT